jgi:hypothetical protein
MGLLASGHGAAPPVPVVAPPPVPAPVVAEDEAAPPLPLVAVALDVLPPPDPAAVVPWDTGDEQAAHAAAIPNSTNQERVMGSLLEDKTR